MQTPFIESMYATGPDTEAQKQAEEKERVAFVLPPGAVIERDLHQCTTMDRFCACWFGSGGHPLQLLEASFRFSSWLYVAAFGLIALGARGESP